MKRFFAVAACLLSVSVVARPLEYSSPSEAGIHPSAVAAFVERLADELVYPHSFVLVRHGKIIAEGWFAPYQPEHPHELYSITKGFTSLAIGFAAQDGLLSIDDPVIHYFPGKAVEPVSDRLAMLTIRDLLMLRPGWDPGDLGPGYDAIFENRETAGDPFGVLINLPQKHLPGRFYVYNEIAPFLLSAIIAEVTGKPLDQYLAEKLFTPLGFEQWHWRRHEETGVAFGGFGLALTTRDLAKYGIFLLNYGNWDGRQLLNKAYMLEASTAHRPHPKTTPEAVSAETADMGYLFAVNEFGGYRNAGAGSQYVIAIPEYDLVVAITAGRRFTRVPMQITEETLLAELRGEFKTDPAVTDASVTEKCRHLALPLPPSTGKAVWPLKNGTVTLRPVRNEGKWPPLTLEYTGDRILVSSGDAAPAVFALEGWSANDLEYGKMPKFAVGRTDSYTSWQENGFTLTVFGRQDSRAGMELKVVFEGETATAVLIFNHADEELEFQSEAPPVANNDQS